MMKDKKKFQKVDTKKQSIQCFHFELALLSHDVTWSKLQAKGEIGSVIIFSDEHALKNTYSRLHIAAVVQ